MENKKTNRRPLVEDYKYDEATREARQYFFHELPLSVSGNPIKELSPAQEQYDKLRAAFAGEANEIVEQEYLNAQSINPETTADELDQLGSDALKIGKMSGTAEAKNVSRAIALESIATPGDQPESSKRLAKLSDENISKLLNAKDRSGSGESIPEVVRELSREKHLIEVSLHSTEIKKYHQEYKDHYGPFASFADNERSQNLLNNLAQAISSLETPEDQIRATYEAMEIIRHEDSEYYYESDKMPRQDILKPILEQSPFQADLVENYDKLEPAPPTSSGLFGIPVFDDRSLLHDIVELSDSFNSDSLEKLYTTVLAQDEDFRLPRSALSGHPDDFTPRDDMLVRLGAERGDEISLKYLRRLNSDEQRDYLEKIVSKDEGPTLSTAQMSSIPKIDTEGITLPHEDIDAIAESSGVDGAFLMLHLAKSGMTEVDRPKYIRQAIELNSKNPDTFHRDLTETRISRIIQSDVLQRTQNTDKSLIAEKNRVNAIESIKSEHEYLTAAYEAAIESKSPYIILESKHPDSSINVFKEIIREKKDDPLELYKSFVNGFSDDDYYELYGDLSPLGQIHSLYDAEEIDHKLITDYLEVGLYDTSDDSIEYFIDQHDQLMKEYLFPEMSHTHDSVQHKLRELLPDINIAEGLANHGRVGLLNKLTEKADYELLAFLKVNPILINWNIDHLSKQDATELDFKNISDYLTSDKAKYMSENLNEENYKDYRDFQRLYQQTNSVMSSCGATLEGFRAIRDLESLEETPQYLTELGITHTGDKGVEQFKSLIRSITSEYKDVNYSDDTLATLRSSPLHQSIFRKVYRCDESLDLMNPTDINKVLEYRHQHESSIEPIKDVFETKTYKIRSIGEQADRSEISLTTQEIFNSRAQDILEYRDESDSISIIKNLSEDLMLQKQQVDQILQSIEDGDNEKFLQLEDDRKKQYFIQNEQRKLDSINSALEYLEDGSNDASEIFELLHNINELHPHLRKLITFQTIAGMDELDRKKLYRNIQPEEDLSPSNLTALKDFLSQAASSVPLQNKNAKKNLKGLFNTRFIDDELTRFNQADQTGSKYNEFSFIPTRGLGMELSGELSDTCWAGEYKSIAQKFPNITSVIFKRHSANSDHERLVGSMMLIEGESVDGEPVLIARGINPIENQTSKINNDDFIEAVFDYVKDTAQKLNAKPATVNDGYTAGATTNRPLISKSISNFTAKLDKIAIEDTDLVAFNGLSLNDIVYRLD